MADSEFVVLDDKGGSGGTGTGEGSNGAGEITFGADEGEFFDPDTNRGDITFGDDEGSEFVSAPDPDRAIQTKSELTNERFT
jgi:hypothetical protein